MSKVKETLSKKGEKVSSGNKILFRVSGNEPRTGIFLYHDSERGMDVVKPDNGKRMYKTPGRLELLTDDQYHVMKNKVDVNNLFDINTRFNFLESLVRMVIDDILVSLIITGEGGIGKTYTVLTQVERAGLVRPDNFWVIKGYSTAKGLYETLYEHNGKLIIFDDCDEVLKDPTAKNILKGALDSYSERVISWVTSTPERSNTPAEFEFTGKIMFISNLHKAKIDQAIVSRAATIDLSMSIEDKMARIYNILPHLCKNLPVTMEQKEKAFKIVYDLRYSANDLNIRTVIKTIQAIASSEENAEELAKFMILS